MASMFVVRSPPLPRAEADELAQTLGEAGEPQAGAVSLIEADERRDLWRVEAYYEEEPTRAAIEELGLDPDRLVIEPLPDTDWVARSLEGLAPVRAGRFLIHGSHDRDLPPGGCAVEITAGTAFGTGHHATTRGCLLAADRLLRRRRPRRILDLGSGTGVLAIAAARVSRAPALAVDIDPEAVRVTRDNARLNGAATLVKAALALPARTASRRRLDRQQSDVIAGLDPAIQGRRLTVRAPWMPASGTGMTGRLRGNAANPAGAALRFDLIFANILAGPLVDLAPELAARLGPGGALVLSGLMVDQERQVSAAYRNRNLRLDHRLRLDNWSILVFTQPGRQRRRHTRE